MEDTSNIVSCFGGIDKTLDLISPISTAKGSNSALTSPMNFDADMLRKDIIRLTVENKYLKRKVTGCKSEATKNCYMCKKYLEIIDTLSNEKNALETETKNRIFYLQSNYDRVSREHERLKEKYEIQYKELLDKLDSEDSLKSKVEELNSKKENLISHIKNSFDSYKGFEFLEDTFAGLSLALINKNDKDLSYKQKQLLRDIFEDNHIKVINNFKEKISVLEQEAAKSCQISKAQIDANSQLSRIAKRYVLAVKECVDLYSYYGLDASSFGDKELTAYISKHASRFISEFEGEIGRTLLQVNELSNGIDNEMKNVESRFSELHLEKYEELCVTPINKSSQSKCRSRDVSQNGGNDTPFSDMNSDFMKNIFTTFNIDDNKSSETKDAELSKEDKANLLSMLQSKDKEIQELKEKCKEGKNSANRKLKKKNRVNKKADDIKDKQEKMIQESLEELQMLLDEEEAMFNEPNLPNKPRNLFECDNHTIKEVDERDEEETIFDKDGNKVFSRSLKSVRGHENCNDFIFVQSNHCLEVDPV
eukprot:CAMPEP_0168326492 /NCGR_PEP_ID=MMETSP0213-20121227/5324_1 /TAXON_ID=151035 /ORGANISM="Euplotes harpa, Strain FSP1.4" /LENGTH=534 /DNA_ID=CAMNT_0008329195 /DNA_START=2490 /DNA_END=4094 /DNA_ORIENTATION=-